MIDLPEACPGRWLHTSYWAVQNSTCFVFIFVSEITSSSLTKTSIDRVVVLNEIAQNVIDSRRGIRPDYVFTFRGNPVQKLRTSAWRRNCENTGLPVQEGILKGVHNLRHTFGRRLRAAGVPLEICKELLGHATGDITTHYSVAELQELIGAGEKITGRAIA